MSGPARRRLARAAVAGGWALAAGMTGIVVNRVFRSRRFPRLIGLQSVGMWLLVPAYPLAVAALCTRRWALGGVAVSLSVAHIGWRRQLSARGTPRAAPVGAARMRLVTANIFNSNSEMAFLAADLAAIEADLLLLQEVTEQHLDVLRAAGVLDRYPYQVLAPSERPHGSAILSTLPIGSGGVIEIAGYPITRADVMTEAGTVVVLNVHPLAPSIPKQVAPWHDQLAALGGLAARETGPLIVAGDFNATADHLPMGRLLDDGLRDAFDEAGRGVGATWPIWHGPMIPVMRLDHVLVRGPITVLSAKVQDNRGSDHRRVSVDVAVGCATAPQ